MSRLIKEAALKAGQSPGSLIFTGNQKTENVKISIFDYNTNKCVVKENLSIEECLAFKKSKKKKTVTWINIDGLHDTSIIEKVGSGFGIHPLVLEDILHIGQRPKIDIYDDYIYIVLMMLSYDEVNNRIATEQVSIILGKDFVISFQEDIGDVFDPIRNLIQKSGGRIRKMGADYLTYSLLDIIVDNYFLILEKVGDRLEHYEEDLIAHPKHDVLKEVYELKREVLFLRKAVWPLREFVGRLDKAQTWLITDATAPYFRDLYDHTIQVVDTVETSRDLLSVMLDLYLSSISNRLNEVMKVLTIISTIFIPLTFLSGVYGMNFHFMPELSWKYGYPVFWLIIIISSIGMVYYFKRKKWF